MVARCRRLSGTPASPCRAATPGPLPVPSGPCWGTRRAGPPSGSRAGSASSSSSAGRSAPAPWWPIIDVCWPVQTVDYERLALADGARVLDLGCGEGRHVQGAVVAGVGEVIGVDLSAA